MVTENGLFLFLVFSPSGHNRVNVWRSASAFCLLNAPAEPHWPDPNPARSWSFMNKLKQVATCLSSRPFYRDCHCQFWLFIKQWLIPAVYKLDTVRKAGKTGSAKLLLLMHRSALGIGAARFGYKQQHYFISICKKSASSKHHIPNVHNVRLECDCARAQSFCVITHVETRFAWNNFQISSTTRLIG